MTIPSDTYIQFLPGCGLILRPLSPAGQLYQNSVLSRSIGGSEGNGAGTSTAATLGDFGNQNIYLKGGIHNCNTQNQAATNDTSLLHGTKFSGVTNFWCVDIYYIDGSLWWANCQYFGARASRPIATRSTPGVPASRSTGRASISSWRT